MAVNGTPAEATAIGRVVAVNEKGIRFEGAESWSNYSKFAVGIVPPSRGDTVSVTFDRQGFIRAIVPADGRAATNGVTSAHRALSSDRDRTISRLAVLKAAAEFGASRPELKSGDVLRIAESWERWVLRDDDPSELVDAF